MTQDQMLMSAAEYFRGERSEAWILVGATVALLLAGLALVWGVRDGFAYGLGGMLVLSSLILGGTAGTIIVRDPGLSVNVSSGLTNAERRAETLKAEMSRVDRVLADFTLYTRTFLALGALAIALLVFVQAPVVRGIAVGLLVMLAAQATIDHFGESRAKIYAERLMAFRGAR